MPQDLFNERAAARKAVTPAAPQAAGDIFEQRAAARAPTTSRSGVPSWAFRPLHAETAEAPTATGATAALTSEPVKELGWGLARGGALTAASVGTAMKVMGGVPHGPVSTGLRAQGELLNQYWTGVYERLPKGAAAGTNLFETPGKALNPKWLAASVGEMIPGFVAALGTALIAGPTAGAIVGGGLEGTGTYETIKARGGSDQEAAKGFMRMALASGILNKVSLNAMFSRIGGTLKVPLDAVVEAFTEWMEEPVEGAILGEDISERAKQGLNVVPASLIMGGLAGSGLRRPAAIRDEETPPPSSEPPSPPLPAPSGPTEPSGPGGTSTGQMLIGGRGVMEPPAATPLSASTVFQVPSDKPPVPEVGQPPTNAPQALSPLQLEHQAQAKRILRSKTSTPEARKAAAGLLDAYRELERGGEPAPLGAQPTRMMPGEELPRAITPIKTPLPSRPTVEAVEEPLPTPPPSETGTPLTQAAPVTPTVRAERPTLTPKVAASALKKNMAASERLLKQLARPELTPEQRHGYEGDLRAAEQSERELLAAYHKSLGRAVPQVITKIRARLESPEELLRVDFLRRSVSQHDEAIEERARRTEMRAAGTTPRPTGESTVTIHIPAQTSPKGTQIPAREQEIPAFHGEGPALAAREILAAQEGKRRAEIPNWTYAKELQRALRRGETIEEWKADPKQMEMRTKYDALRAEIRDLVETTHIDTSDPMITSRMDALKALEEKLILGAMRTHGRPTKADVAIAKGVSVESVKTTGAGEAVDPHPGLPYMTQAMWVKHYGGAKGKGRPTLAQKTEKLAELERNRARLTRYAEALEKREAERGFLGERPEPSDAVKAILIAWLEDVEALTDRIEADLTIDVLSNSKTKSGKTLGETNSKQELADLANSTPGLLKISLFNPRNSPSETIEAIIGLFGDRPWFKDFLRLRETGLEVWDAIEGPEGQTGIAGTWIAGGIAAGGLTGGAIGTAIAGPVGAIPGAALGMVAGGVVAAYRGRGTSAELAKLRAAGLYSEALPPKDINFYRRYLGSISTWISTPSVAKRIPRAARAAAKSLIDTHQAIDNETHELNQQFLKEAGLISENAFSSKVIDYVEGKIPLESLSEKEEVVAETVRDILQRLRVEIRDAGRIALIQDGFSVLTAKKFFPDEWGRQLYYPHLLEGGWAVIDEGGPIATGWLQKSLGLAREKALEYLKANPGAKVHVSEQEYKPFDSLHTPEARLRKLAADLRELDPDSPDLEAEIDKIYGTAAAGAYGPKSTSRPQAGFMKPRTMNIPGWMRDRASFVRYIERAVRYIHLLKNRPRYMAVRNRLAEGLSERKAESPADLPRRVASRLVARLDYAIDGLEGYPSDLEAHIARSAKLAGLRSDTIAVVSARYKELVAIAKFALNPMSPLVNLSQPIIYGLNLREFGPSGWALGFQGLTTEYGKFRPLLDELNVRARSQKLDIEEFETFFRLYGGIRTATLFPFTSSEFLNQAIVVIGSYKKAIKEGAKPAIAKEIARRANLRINFEYARFDRPQALQELGATVGGIAGAIGETVGAVPGEALRYAGAESAGSAIETFGRQAGLIIGSVLGRSTPQFKTFPIKALEYETGLRGAREIGGHFMMLLALGGVRAIFQLSWILFLNSLVERASGFNPLNEVLKAPGRAGAAARAFFFGLPFAAGIDVSQNVSFIEAFGPNINSAVGPGNSDILRGISAIPAFTHDLFGRPYGSREREAAKSDFLRNISPEARRLWDAWQDEDVLEDPRTGAIILRDITENEKKLLSFGFTPSRISLERLLNSFESLEAMHRLDRRGYIVDQIAASIIASQLKPERAAYFNSKIEFRLREAREQDNRGDILLGLGESISARAEAIMMTRPERRLMRSPLALRPDVIERLRYLEQFNQQSAPSAP